MDRNTKRQWVLSLAYAVGAVVIVSLLRLLLAGPEVRELSYTSFVALVRADSVAEAQVSETRLTGVLKRQPGATDHPPGVIAATRIPGMDDQPLLDDFAAHGVSVTGALEHTAAWYDVLLTWLLPLGLLALLYRWTFRRMARGPGGALTLGTNKAKIYDQSAQIGVTFADVAGVDEARAELVEVVDFLKNPGRYQKLGGHIPRGVLLVGPPGTGKTLLARAVAGEAGVPFFSISGSEFVEMFVGVGAARVRDLFAEAKQRAPCIIFIDELDAIGKSRATGRGILYSNEEREQTLGQLLAEMDGFSHSDAVIVLAATNAPETLDAALVRPGRFDRQIVIDRPDIAGREAILRVHARKVQSLPEVDWKVIAGRTPGMVGADLANVVNEAALLAARRGAEAVATRDLEEAIDRVILGLAKKSRVMTSGEKERVAFHETGHALVAVHLDQSSPVHRVSIIPRSIGALGHTLQLPTEERYLMTANEIEDRLAVMLGGRTAEELIFGGVVSTGAADDLEKATELAHQMVTRFGMSQRLGPIAYGRPTGLRFLGDFGSEERNYSEETAREIDMETRRVIEEAYARAREILTGHLAELERIGRELIQRETLTGEELRAMLTPAPAPAPSGKAKATTSLGNTPPRGPAELPNSPTAKQVVHQGS